jgi:hypothetical protein
MKPGCIAWYLTRIDGTRDYHCPLYPDEFPRCRACSYMKNDFERFLEGGKHGKDN